MTQTASPRLMVLGDWEGLVGTAPGMTRLRELCSVTVLDRPVAEVPDRTLAEVRFLLAVRERTPLDAPTLARFPRLELVLQTGSHAYHADPDALRRRRVLVALGRRGRAVGAAVPELTLLLMLACVRRVGEASRAMQSGDWPTLPGRILAGRRLGVLGLGRHGRRVARLAAALDMAVTGWDRVGERAGRAVVDGRPGPHGLRLLPLSKLLATSDVVSVHLRLSDESRGLLGRDQLSAMKPRSVLVNTARGAVVDELALADALREGPLAAAGLDVFAAEPLAAEHPLRSLPNVVLTPHVGWTVEEVFAESAEIAANQLDAYLAGRLDPSDLLDVGVEPAEGALGGVLEASAR
jgi:phosphoglycerate dehydrogenase-like enzyme